MKQQQKQIQEPKRRLRTSASTLEDDLILGYVGKHVIIEESEIGVAVSSGTLSSYDGRFVTLTDYIQHKVSLHDVQLNFEENVIYHSRYDLTKPESVGYYFPSRTLNSSLIASIQLFDDVTRQEQQGASQ